MNLTPTTLRLFPAPVTNYLTAAEVIATHGLTYNAELLEEDTTLTREVIQQFITDVIKAKNRYIGQDKRSDQRDATDQVENKMFALRKPLKSILNIIENKFGEAESAELLNKLGYTAWWRPATRSQSQRAMIELLKQFRDNLTDERRDLLLEKGANPNYLQIISTEAEKFDTANTAQEVKKGESVVLTQEAVIAINALHLRLRDILDAGKNAFSADRVRRRLFSLDATMSAMTSSRGNSGTTDASE